MPSLPRIITVDPTGNAARLVRAAIDVSEYACRQIDVPSGEEALEEIRLGSADLVVSALDLEDMSSLALVDETKAVNEQTAILILGEETDPEMTITEQRDRGLVYFRRPLDIQQFSQVVFAGMKGRDIFQALRQPSDKSNGPSYGPVPQIDDVRAGAIVDQLLIDLGAMSIMLMGRDSTLLLERGADNFLNRESLVNALMPTVQSTIQMRDLVGGDATVLQFYDGDQRDVYTLSVGLHHMLCIAYDGERGQREFGMVNRLGRRAAMDLIALVGAEAFLLQRSMPEQSADDTLPRRTSIAARIQTDEMEIVHLERTSDLAGDDGPDLEALEMEAISEDDFDPSFLDQLGEMDLTQADQLFALDNMDGSDLNVKIGKTISDEEARQIGLFGD
jgi:CheY-like chemotaxis protein